MPIQGRGKTILHANFTFVNKSKLPISITSMEIKFKNHHHYFSGNKVKISTHKETQGGQTIFEETYFSTELPQTIQQLGSMRGRFHIDLTGVILEDILNIPVALGVHTNRKSKFFYIHFTPIKSEREKL